MNGSAIETDFTRMEIPMNVLVTGGAGYLGSIFVPKLLSLGHEVTVVDNFMYKQTSLLDYCHNPGLQIVRGDARDKGLIQKLMAKADWIFPLACLTGAPICSQMPLEAQSINYDAIKAIMAMRSKSQRIIFPTTNSGYGIGEKGVHCTEETPLNPVSLYGRLKVRLESELLESENCITLRLATVFGASPRMRIDLLANDFTYRAVHDGFIVLYQAHFMRNFIHVRDITRAFVHSMDHFEDMKNQPYNVGLSDANLSKWQLCELIKKRLPGFYFVEAEVGEDPDKRDYIVSNEKIESTGYKAIYSIGDGISELINAYNIIKRNQFANV
jgi:nucleoside-diphosphate-sugar epimerase